MNKLMKGAIAAAVGVGLIMGGSGTLASWNASAAAGSAQIVTAGQLAVTSAGAGVWTNSHNVAITPSSYAVAPGETLTYTQSFAVAAGGDNLYLTVTSAPGALVAGTGSASAALLAQLTKTPSFTVTGNSIALTGVTPGVYKVAAGTTASTVVITMTISLPFGSSVDNSAQSGSVTLGPGAVTLNQVASP